LQDQSKIIYLWSALIAEPPFILPLWPNTSSEQLSAEWEWKLTWESYSPLRQKCICTSLRCRYNLHKMSLALLTHQGRPNSLLSTAGISGWLINWRFYSLP